MLTIGTHNGKFHCDEALACFILKMLPEFADAHIVRTRDQVLLDQCTVVVDVGGQFDPKRKRFDHHQREFKHTLGSLGIAPHSSTKLSSAGLVFAHFGRQYISEVLKKETDAMVVNSGDVDVLFETIYADFIEEIDAVDNGISAFDGVPRYYISSTISQRVSRLNPAWNCSIKNDDEQFNKAMQLVGSELNDRVLQCFKIWLPARNIVRQMVESRFQVDVSGRIMELPEGGVPWKQHFFKLEKELKLETANITFVIFADADNLSWRVMAIPIGELQEFTCRYALPEEWRGLRGEQLDEKVGIHGSVFVHSSGFIGGHTTRDGALHMARLALKQQQEMST